MPSRSAPHVSGSIRYWLAVSVAGLLLLASAGARASADSRRELSEVRHSRPNLDRGAELFATCAACHGADGQGTRDGQIPRIGGQHASVLQTELVDFRHDRRWDPRMEHFADNHHLPDAQAIADVTAYISHLNPEAEPGSGSGQTLQLGSARYARECRSCHGESAQGDAGRAVPKLAGQQYEYLRRQIHDAVEGRRPNFPRDHVRLLARLDYQDIDGLADYLSRLGGGPSRRGGGSGPRLGADLISR